MNAIYDNIFTALFLLYTYAQYVLVTFLHTCLCLCVKDDTSRLIEEGQLEVKLKELDKLERAAKKNPQPAWLVNIIFI